MSILFDTKPLVVNVTLATIIGLNEAIILQQIHYWVDRSSHKIEGRKWIYNSVRSWAEQFPFWSEPTIKRAISSLEKRGLLISGKHNRDARDQTKWYTIDYRALNNLVEGEHVTDASDQNDPMEQIKMTQCNGSKWTNSLDQNDPTITRDYTETTAETTTEITEKEKASRSPVNDQASLLAPVKPKPDDPVEPLFRHWQTVHNHPRAKLDAKRRKRIREALKLGYTVDDLKMAIEGCARSPYHMGDNDNGMRYDSLDLIFRSAEHIDRFIAIYHNPPKLRGKLSRIEAINDQAVRDFLGGDNPFQGTTIDGEVIDDA